MKIKVPRVTFLYYIEAYIKLEKNKDKKLEKLSQTGFEPR